MRTSMMIFSRRKPSDLREAIVRFLATVPQDAAIRRVLTSVDLEKLLAAFDDADAKALRKQRSYRRARRLAVWAGFIGALVAALGLLPIQSWLPPSSYHALKVLTALSFILTLLAIMWLSLGKSGVRWMEQRGKAEKARAEFFRAVMQVGVSAKEMLPSTLACFTFAHLDW